MDWEKNPTSSNWTNLVKNTDTNAKSDICFQSGIKKVLAQSADFYLIQGLPLGYIKSSSTWQSNGEKATEEQSKDNGYES